MSYLLGHSHLGFCWLDLVALLVLIAIVLVFVIRHNRLKKEEKELEERLSDECAEEAMNAEKVL